MLATGTTALIFSIVYTSSILAFIGLGLLFWGAILTYIKNEEYAKKTILDAVSLSSLGTINHTLQELGYNGEATYLPPKYLRDPAESKAYIPKQKDTRLPSPERVQTQEPQLLTQNPPAILLTPPGAELTKLFEKTLNTNFTKTDLPYVQQNLSKLFVEDLEIAEDAQLENRNNTIQITLKNTVFKDTSKETQKLSDTTRSLGSPLSSAIACMLTKATGKPIKINKEETSQDNKTLTIEYHILEEEKQEQPQQ
jgi:hypothetical protein